MRTEHFKKALLLASVLMLNGCVDSDCMDESCLPDWGKDFSVNRAPLSAQCTIYVNGFGAVAMESDYVPGVTACENGSAGTEGLKAQAVSARTFAYYKLNNNAGTASNPINNSQGDQVYSCSYTSTADKHREAANATSGIVLTYGNAPICAFYVSGSTVGYLNNECKFTGDSSSAGWVSQQKYVTYNLGKSGSNVTQSSLGWVAASNKANRGCMSQNGAKCLASAGKDWQYIIHFFYGDDIGITQAEGSCVNAPVVKCETVIPAGGGTLEETDACFSREASNSWHELSAGSGSHLFYTYVWDKAAEAVGTWKLNMAAAGKYKVEAYIASGIGAMSERAPYTVRANGSEKTVAVNVTQSGWVTIGTFDFAKGGDQWVKLSDASGEPYTDTNGKRIAFDAIRLSVAETCTNACTEGAKECSGNGVRTCSKGTNGCTAWSGVTNCASGQTCEGGVCKAPACTDACTEGAKECSGNGVRTCSRGSNNCTAWSGVTACGDDQSCANGVCVKKCANQCSKGDVKCVDNGVSTCETINGCLDWTAAKACDTNSVCVSGACVEKSSECEDECIEGELSCNNNRVTKCEKNALGCLSWSNSTTCEADKICSGGRCVLKPSDSTTYEPWNGTTPTMPEGCSTVIDGRPSVIIDETDKCFSRASSLRWNEFFDFGYDNHMYYAYITNGMPSAVGTWHLNVTKAGSYDIYVYVENNIGAVSKLAPYTVRAGKSSVTYPIDFSRKSGWYKISTFNLEEGTSQYVQLMDATGEDLKDNDGKRVVYDAIQIVPAGTVVEGAVDPNDEDNKPGNGDQNGDDDEPGTGDNDPGTSGGSHLKGGNSVSDDCSSVPLSNGGQFPLALLLGAFGFGLASRRRRHE